VIAVKPRVFITRELPGDAINRVSEYYEVEVWGEYQPLPRHKLLEKLGM